ncbi:MAG: hypothetical protein KA354_16775 [Phycisphaerae bacterium]|nr:hypothetical protein [Phycisphaerae bacterium]
MPLNHPQLELIERFRGRVETAMAEEAGFGACSREDRQDHSTLATRWVADKRVWYECTVRPFLPQVRAGIMTDDRWRSEGFEQMIEDSGDTMPEFVGMGFENAGLAWPDLVVEHYRDQGRCFYFATPLALDSIGQLADEAVFDKIRRMLKGYHLAFTGLAGR